VEILKRDEAVEARTIFEYFGVANTQADIRKASSYSLWMRQDLTSALRSAEGGHVAYPAAAAAPA
jgi:hypothetical protein